METRLATLDDAAAMAEIYNQGIADRVATFETRWRTADDVRAWFTPQHPIIVVVNRDEVIAFASTSTYRPRECYAGITEFSVYVARDQERHGRATSQVFPPRPIGLAGNQEHVVSAHVIDRRGNNPPGLAARHRD